MNQLLHGSPVKDESEVSPVLVVAMVCVCVWWGGGEVAFFSRWLNCTLTSLLAKIDSARACAEWCVYVGCSGRLL